MEERPYEQARIDLTLSGPKVEIEDISARRNRGRVVLAIKTRRGTRCVVMQPLVAARLGFELLETGKLRLESHQVVKPRASASKE